MKKNADRWFPLFVDLHGRKIVVLGVGKIAARRVGILSSFAEDITIVSPEIHPQLEQILQQNGYRWINGTYRPEYLERADLVLVCTADRTLNEEIAHACKKKGILVNAASDRRLCDFHFPGILLHEEFTIGLHGGGTHHKEVKALREELETWLTNHSGQEEKERK